MLLEVALRPGGQLELVDLCGVAQWSRPAPGHRLVEPKVVAAQGSDVGAHKRRHPGEIFVAYLGTRLPQVGDRFVEIERVPEGNGVEDGPERGELVFLTLSVALANLPPVAVEDFAGDVVAKKRASCSGLGSPT